MTSTVAPVVGRPIRGLSATLYRELLLLTRDRVNFALSVAPTIIYLLLLATSMSRMMPVVTTGGATMAYGTFITPTVVMSALLSSSMTVASALFQEEMSRMSLELWSHPLRRSSYFVGKLLAGLAVVLGQAVATLLLATAVLDLDWNVTQALAMLGASALTGTTLICAYLLFAVFVREFRRFMILGSVSLQVLLFGSPSFYPQEQMAPFARAVSIINPVTYGLTCMRDAAVLNWAGVLPVALGMVAFCTVAAGIVVRMLARRMDNL